MAIERRNPVPKGRYWVAIFDTPRNPSARLLFDNYLARNANTIAVLRKDASIDILTGQAQNWYLFDVTAPTTWELNQGFGLPTIVRSAENPSAPEVNSPDDVVTRPEKPPTFAEQLDDLFASAKGIGLAIAVIWAVSTLKSRR